MEENYIISTCVIRNNIVLKNNTTVFAASTGKLSSFLSEVYHLLKIDYPKFYKMDNLSKLGFLAAEVLLKDEEINIYKPEETAIVLTNSYSSLDADVKYFETTKTFASPGLFVYTLPNIVMGEICIRHHFKGENAFFVFEKFDAGFLEKYVAGLMKENKIQFCICGWVDVFGEDYNAVLFLTGKNKKDDSPMFSKVEMEKVFFSK